MTLCLPTLLVSAVALSAAGATAATFGELSQAAPQPAPVAAVPAPTCPPYCAPAPRPPAAEGALPSAPPGAQPYVSVPAPVPMGYPPFGAGPGIAPGGPLPACRGFAVSAFDRAGRHPGFGRLRAAGASTLARVRSAAWTRPLIGRTLSTRKDARCRSPLPASRN